MSHPPSSSDGTPAADDASTPLRHRHVIVAGYGPVGRATAQQLEQVGVRVTIIELNPTTAARQQRLDKSMVLGDVSDPQILLAAGVEQADALILTIPDEAAAVRACQNARRLNPHIFIAARTSFLSQGLLATQAGADHVVVEEIVTAQAMQQAVMERLLGQTSDSKR